MKKVYLMIYDSGAGHRSIANSLKTVIEKRQLPWEVHIVEAFKEIIGTSAPQDVYNNLILKTTWGKMITEPLLVPLLKLQIRLSHSVWLARFKRYWQEHQPDLVISLLPYVNGLIYESLQAVSPHVPFATSITDHADSPPHFWIEAQKQLLICPSEQAVEQARNLGYIPEQILRTSGVVINPRFYEPITVDRRLERQRLGLNPDVPTGLIAFGGQGSKAMLEIANYLENSPSLQLIFICGRNEEIANTLRSQKSRLPRVVVNFTSEIPYYMHLSDFFIGKSGAVGVSEAVAMKLPVITDCNSLTLFQERPSAAWIAANELGIIVNDFREINQAVAKLIEPETLARYRANTATINNKAVFEVVDIMTGLLESSSKTAQKSLSV